MTKSDVQAVAASIRSLSIDAIEAANSGHPGLPMGIAEVGALIYGDFMKHDPQAPDWFDRDRFVLSAGHGSMLLYSLLYLCGYGMTLDDIKHFRQVGSPAAGHPERGFSPGIETTTGPLGQGLANAVGMAIAEAMFAARFNTPKHTIVDHYTYVIAGDGDMMEGITGEASSLAGHLGLSKLIVFYDSNHVSLDGNTNLSFSEDVLTRYRGYHWQTLQCDAYDVDGLIAAVAEAKRDKEHPTIIMVNSILGKGAPTKAGTSKAHGSALGAEEAAGAKKNLGIPVDTPFWVDPAAVAFFAKRRTEWKAAHEQWVKIFDDWSKANPALRAEWDLCMAKTPQRLDKVDLPSFKIGDKVATRKASGMSLNAIAKVVPNLVGGAADLASSNDTAMPDYGDFTKTDRKGRTLHFGVREHAMGAALSGMSLHGGLRPFGATFLVFTDYLRPTFRLASIMKMPNIYIMTHDSIYLGEDGTTHQPVEQLNSLRMIPGVEVLRPGDAEETTEAWMMAIRRTDGPTVLVFTRQNIEVYKKADADWRKNMNRGAYIVADSTGAPDVVVAATGSEVTLALKAASLVKGKKVRIVSMVSRELFLKQDTAFRSSLLPKGARVVTAEAGVSSGWEGIASQPEDIFGIDRFGESGKGEEVAKHLGFTAERLAALIDR